MKSPVTKTKAPAKQTKSMPDTTILDDELPQPGPVYFWQADGDDGYLGQWYKSSFIWRKPVDGGQDDEFEELHYQTAEQYVSQHTYIQESYM